MIHDAASIDTLLPHPAPSGRAAHLLLHVIRRMAIGGLADAHAANAMLGLFGKSYRRPLVLMRAFMAELARGSLQPIIVAPCCCSRMTQGEATLLAAVAVANSDIQTAHIRLTALSGTPDCIGALTSAQAVEQAFRDLGRPVRG
jgi:hypothetical protein